MIVTLDASILVRATKRAAGSARRVVDVLAADAGHVIALSSFILGEVGKVLSYPRMRALYKLNDDEIENHVRFLRSVSRIANLRAACP
jgi:hypothetical protein